MNRVPLIYVILLDPIGDSIAPGSFFLAGLGANNLVGRLSDFNGSLFMTRFECVAG